MPLSARWKGQGGHVCAYRTNTQKNAWKLQTILIQIPLKAIHNGKNIVYI